MGGVDGRDDGDEGAWLFDLDLFVLFESSALLIYFRFGVGAYLLIISTIFLLHYLINLSNQLINLPPFPPYHILTSSPRHLYISLVPTSLPFFFHFSIPQSFYQVIILSLYGPQHLHR